MTTLSPASAKRVAATLPTPLAAPVTTATPPLLIASRYTMVPDVMSGKAFHRDGLPVHISQPKGRTWPPDMPKKPLNQAITRIEGVISRHLSLQGGLRPQSGIDRGVPKTIFRRLRSTLKHSEFRHVRHPERRPVDPCMQ